ncbi:uncharacterized protein BDZ99DRAFT_543150 [Mytilinidion resinicola]|uniref:Uncharacterized protein n=1 Tax=Mytilinidion resinicola TaxID=574789 RepID=A0A6A6Z614_9PEZI|nr:uncharacterized protein BDZ99DRAFT_543150 [Mytilinidion resinicola]KAF2816542.1 hypothetical protein BDZ99DRAFT_543150 [Mytilinidion resinicola]
MHAFARRPQPGIHRARWRVERPGRGSQCPRRRFCCNGLPRSPALDLAGTSRHLNQELLVLSSGLPPSHASPTSSPAAHAWTGCIATGHGRPASLPGAASVCQCHSAASEQRAASSTHSAPGNNKMVAVRATSGEGQRVCASLANQRAAPLTPASARQERIAASRCPGLASPAASPESAADGVHCKNGRLGNTSAHGWWLFSDKVESSCMLPRRAGRRHLTTLAACPLLPGRSAWVGLQEHTAWPNAACTAETAPPPGARELRAKAAARR